MFADCTLLPQITLQVVQHWKSKIVIFHNLKFLMLSVQYKTILCLSVSVHLAVLNKWDKCWSVLSEL